MDTKNKKLRSVKKNITKNYEREPESHKNLKEV